MSGMALGMNLGPLQTYNAMFPFANIAFMGADWVQVAGSGSFTQDQGLLNATVGTDEFRMEVFNPNSGATLPAGTYTLLNPSGLQIGFGGFSSSAPSGYSTTTTQNVVYDGVSFLCLYVKGSATNASGNFSLIRPGHTASYAAGNPWYDQFLTFVNGLNTKLLRFMDWLRVNDNIETNWADRTLPSKPTFRHRVSSYSGSVVPWEFVVDLANRTSKDPWVCIPTRATTAYASSLGDLLNNGTGAVATPGCGSVGTTGLGAGRVAYIEYGNEIWNQASIFAAGYTWNGFGSIARISCSVNAATDVVTATAHGLVTGDKVAAWCGPASRAVVDDDPYYQACWGGDLYAEVLDSNTFKLHQGSSVGTLMDFPTGVTDLVISKTTGVSSFTNNDSYYGGAALGFWNAVAAKITTARIKRVLGAHCAAPASVTNRLAPAGVAAACDVVAIAPYNTPEAISLNIDIASGQFTPKFWSNKSGNVIVNVYPAASTPSEDDLVAGNGATYHAASTAYSYAGSSYTALTAATGLTNGTSYKVYVTYISGEPNRGVYKWTLVSGAITPAVTTSTVQVSDTFANQQTREQLATDIEQVGYWQSALSNIAASSNPAIKLVCYEANIDWGTTQAPSDQGTWQESYLESSNHAAALDHFMRTMADVGIVTSCHYGDLLYVNGVYSIAKSLSNTSDARYVKYASFSGTVPQSTRVSVGDQSPPDILTAPGTLPYTVCTFANAALTYTILGGNGSNNYDISGNTLRMIATTGISFAAPTQRTVYLRASDGQTTSEFKVVFNTGSAWYASDAVFALDMTTQASNTTLTPNVGSALPITNGGAGGTLSGGVLDVLTTQYSSATALTSGMDPTVPFLIAFVGRIDNTAAGYNQLIQVGGGHFITIYPVNGAGTAQWRWYMGAGYDVFSANVPYDNTLAVHWFHSDGAGNCTIGHNQTTDTTLTMPAGFPTATMSTELDLFPNDDVIGSMEIVPRAGMTVAAAKAIVQKLQNLHSIP